MDFKSKINPIILGKLGTELTVDEKALYQKLNPIGFILYARNLYKSVFEDQTLQEAAIKAFIQSLKDLFPDREIQIWIDEEGGALSNLLRVGLKYEEPLLSSLSFYEKFNEAKDEEKILQAIYDQFYAIGLKLKGLGFTGTFAPVADLFYENKSSVIGKRSFGSNVDLVIKFCQASMKGLKNANIDSCIKHFPGHGLADVDSHHYLPVVKESMDFLMQNDFRVFKELAPLAKYAMTAHVIYECIDKENPITVSKNGIDFVRKNLGFENVKIITDAIDMKAVYLATKLDQNEKESVRKIKNLCLEAGCDAVLYCHPDLQILKEFF